MKVIGLTGGVGMGKSTCADLLQKRGIPVVDTDDLAREVVLPNQPALKEIANAFGHDFLTPSGELDRGRMASLVFSDSQARQRLESILHPLIRDLWLAQVETWRSQGHPIAVVVIPLLYETRAERELDKVICVACSAVAQKERLLSRNWSESQITQRLQSQWPVDQKIQASHYLVWSEGRMEVLADQLDRILQRLASD